MIALTHAFGLSRDPFPQDVPVDKLFPVPGLKAFLERFTYAVSLGVATVITGDVGTGKSTSLRAAAAALHPTQYKLITIVATSGGTLELLRQLSMELGAAITTNSVAKLIATIREMLLTVAGKKQTPVMIIDEAHLMRLELFAQLHTIVQLPFDQRPLVPMVLSGQNILLDRLIYHTSKPFASRVIGRTHLEGLKQADMQAYLAHHLQLAGGSPELLADEAVTAIHQSSGGLLRRANHLARGAMLAAAGENSPVVTAEHVRTASTEVI